MSNFKYSLEICSEENTGAIYQIVRKEVVIGRGNVDISIDNPTLSGNHCLLRKDGNQLSVQDLQSRNGTEVNNRRILHEETLTSGDILTLGSVSFRVIAEDRKDRLTIDDPDLDQEKQSFMAKLLSKLPQNKSVKARYERKSRSLMMTLALLSWFILLAPLYFLMDNKLSTTRVERGCSLVQALAATNTVAMKKGNRVMVDSTLVGKERGVDLALVITNKGEVWAPEHLMNRTVSDVYGQNAVAAEQLLIQNRTDGKLDIALPIKHYDFKNSQFIKVGVARILYDPKKLDSGPNLFIVFAICSVVYFLLAIFFSGFIIKSVKKDIHGFQDDCEDVIKGNADLLKEKYSPEFNELTMTFNRMIRKLNSTPESSTQGMSDADPSQLMEMVGILNQPALLVNGSSMVLGCSAGAVQLLECDANLMNNRMLLEIPCKKDFYQGLLEFVFESTQSTSRSTTSLTTNPHGNIEVTSLPVADGFYLILLNAAPESYT